MPAVRELLDRFRPAGAPGAASAAGVPADRQRTASAELDPVFAALADVVAKCAGLRATAVRDAARREAEAAEKARVLVARARADAPAQRAAAAARLREGGAAEATRILDRAAAEADAIRRRAQERRPDLVDRVVAQVRRDLAALVGDGG